MELDDNEIYSKFLAELRKLEKKEDLDKLRVKYLGRKMGVLQSLTSKIPSLTKLQRKGIGTSINELRRKIEDSLDLKVQSILDSSVKSKTDLTVPGKSIPTGGLHPITQVIEETKEIFHYLGFSWLDGPEVDTTIYNFDKLNMPFNHPARDTQQTYYIDNKYLLRTHTSNMQVRFLEKSPPPVRMLFPGRAYRRDMPDATHLPSFYQLEGLLVDENAAMTDLIGSLEYFIKKFFGEKARTRVYGHNFPYTEPSIEVEVFHKKKGWVEILGAGMVHPNVLKNAGVDHNKYRGWAFGMGPDRLTMLKYGIDDLRLLYQNDIGFLNQF